MCERWIITDLYTDELLAEFPTYDAAMKWLLANSPKPGGCHWLRSLGIAIECTNDGSLKTHIPTPYPLH